MKIKQTFSLAQFARLAVAVAATTALAGCSAGSTSNQSLTGLQTGTSGIVTATSGGTVTDSGVASITIGAGALSQDSIVSIGAYTGTLPTAPTGLTLVPSTDITFADQGATLSLPATMTIDYTSTNLGSLSASSIQLYQDDAGVWTLVTGDTLSTANSNVEFSASTLGTYALFAS